MSFRFTIMSVMLCSTLAGCGGGASLGRLPARDGGVDAGPPEFTLTCAPTVGSARRVDAIVDAPTGIGWALDSTVTVGTGVNLRAGTASVLGTAVYWGAGDDRCGMAANSHWWGVRVARLEYDPDRGVHAMWGCLPNTYSALRVTMLHVGDRLGVLYREHSLLHADGQWTESGHVAGLLDLDPLTFTNSFGPFAGVRVSTEVRDGTVHVLSATPRGEHQYARLDGAMNAVDDPVRVGDATKGPAELPFGPIPWGDAMLGLWSRPLGERTSLVAEVFTEDGSVRERWPLEDRLGLGSGALELYTLSSIEGGLVALLRVGDASNHGGTYITRVCADGRFALQRVADLSSAGTLTRRLDHWLVTLVEPGENGDGVAVTLRAVDDAGRRLGAPVVVDRARALTLGDVVVLPSTNDTVALYDWRESMSQPTQLRAVRVFGRATR
jgi:hypothetical protein